jgi:RNA polymerase sigma factor (sigma-70 family)
MKDTHIIELIKGNDLSKASAKLYAYFPVIKKLVLKNNGTKQDAEDIYQEALIILCRKVQDNNFILSSSLNTYLYSVCRFLWSDALKHKNKSIVMERTELLVHNEEIEEDAKEESDLRLAEKAFQMIGENCKELLLLFYFKKLSFKQIASQMRFASEQVAKNQKYRCIEKAKENLKKLKTH